MEIRINKDTRHEIHTPITNFIEWKVKVKVGSYEMLGCD